jgi:hypothetical protein
LLKQYGLAFSVEDNLRLRHMSMFALLRTAVKA